MSLLSKNQILHLKGLGFCRVSPNQVARLEVQEPSLVIFQNRLVHARGKYRNYSLASIARLPDAEKEHVYRREISRRYILPPELASAFPNSECTSTAFCRVEREDQEVIDVLDSIRATVVESAQERYLDMALM